MSEDHTRTVRIKRPSRVAQDERGRTVWVGRVETVELELMSTVALQKVMKSGDGGACSEIRKLARSRKDGVLARDTATGHYRIVSESELKALPNTDELSLVSTQILRKVVKTVGKKDPAGGFDPYDNN
jgi:hypothetical protein